MGDHREIHGSWVFGVEAEQHVSSFDDVPERAGQYFRLHSYWPRCRLMCLVYIRCLFCEASRTSSIGCFVCDLHRFSIKLNGSVKHWKTWYAYFKYTTRMGYVPPPRRLRYRTNLFVIVGLVQRIDDVLLRHNCILEFGVQSELGFQNIIAYNLLFGVKNELIFPRRVFPSRRDAAKFRCLLRNLHGLAIGEWHMYAGSSTSESGWAQIFTKRWKLERL